MTLSAVISAINVGIKNEVFYDPKESIQFEHPLKAYDGPCQCSDQANLLRGLLRSIGIDGTTLYIWAGPNASTLTRYRIRTTGQTYPSFWIIRGSENAAPADPHFKFHAVVSANSTWYDPSYGLSYSSLSFNETAFFSTPQQVSSSFWSSEPLSDYTCDH
jgi:hypothetical protein